MKRIVAILCAVMLLMACCISVSAEGEGSITINNTVAGQDYSIYKIADLSYNATAKAYTYTAVSEWVDFFKAQSAYFSYAEDTGIVTVANGVTVSASDAAAIAAAAIAYAETNSISATESVEADGTTVSFTGLDLGYYLVDSTVGTLCVLDTTDTSFEKDDKNLIPNVSKEVKEDDAWGETNDDNFFATVNFKTTINVVAGAENYVLHDVMDAGLDYAGVSSVTVDGVAVDEANYTVTATDLTDGCDFEISFENSYVATLANKAIVVEYTATINENAVVGGAGNLNKTFLVYGENSDLKSNEATTTTYVYSFDLVKTNESDTTLNGAKFKLYDAATAGNEISVIKIEDGSYRVAKAGETGVEIETLNGKATIAGLDSATYYLEETVAPAGYNKLTARQSVTISAANNDATVTEGIYIEGGVQVINKTGAVLPETGGFGTTMFILVGGLVALLAGIFFVTRVRMSKVVD